MANATLKRTLTLYQVVLFGLAYMTPMIVFGTYGVLADTTKGFVPSAYMVAMTAMLFTAYSYGRMVQAFPVSGSAYTYTRKSISAPLGFMVGWSVLLDYLFLPMVIWLIGGVYLNNAFPIIPVWVWILLFIIITTTVNFIGITMTTKVNLLMMIFQLLVVGLFIVLCIVNLFQGMGTGTIFTFNPFLGEDAEFPQILAGASIACYSFLGFDAVTTLSEETIEPKKTLPRAIFLITLIGGGIFMAASYFLHLVYPDFSAFTNSDAAAYEIALQIGGNLFSAVFLAGLILAQFASGLSAQTSAARLLYAMGRDGVLPQKVFGYISAASRIPVINLCIVGAVGLLAVFLDMTTSTSFINFGAFATFTFVNLSVIAHYFIKEQRRQGKDLILYLLVPLIGAGLDIALFINLDQNALILGTIWAVIGFLYLLAITRFFSRKTPDLQMD
ncbi:APC family permease [Salibacterium aidingense]|uniref:APC family permease n=1 Tax=Salibacterium aidingense TaxID=384933 RepID=UPI00040AB199|nr:APC family permease [Salibacterium aidingense]